MEKEKFSAATCGVQYIGDKNASGNRFGGEKDFFSCD